MATYAADINKLKRYIVYGSTLPCYIAKKPAPAIEDIISMLNFMVSNNKAVDKDDINRAQWQIQTFLNMNQYKHLFPDTEHFMTVLAYYVSFITLDHQIDADYVRHKVFMDIPELASTPSDLFCFVNYRKNFCMTKGSLKGGFSRGTRRAIKNWYGPKTGLQLAEYIGKNRSHHRWDHQDVLKLAHVKFDEGDRLNVRHCVYKHPRKIVEDFTDEEIDPSHIGLKRLYTISKLKVCESPADACQMIMEHNMCIENVPVHLLHENVVWIALINADKLSCNDIIQYLPFLNDHKMLSNVHEELPKRICMLLEDYEFVKISNIHPLNLLLALRQHEQNKRYHETVKEAHRLRTIARKGIVPNPNIVRALRTALDVALETHQFPKLKSIRERGTSYFITLDLRSGHFTKSAYGIGILSVIEVSVLMTLYIVKREKPVHVMKFTEINGVLEPLEIIPTMKYADAFQYCQTRQIETSSQNIYAPHSVAGANNLMVDTFITFIDSLARSVRSKDVEHDKFNDYKIKMNLNFSPRYVVAGLSRHSDDLIIEKDADKGKGRNIMEFAGFNLSAPRVLYLYVKGLYD